MLPLGFLQELFCAHLGVAPCRAFLCLWGVWCWELSNTGTSWAFQLETDHPVLLTLVPPHLLGNKTLSLRDVVKSCDTKKPARSNQLCTNPALHPTEIPCSLPAESLDVCLGDMQEQRLVWKVKLPDKNCFGAWADEHFGSLATVGLFLLTSDDISNSFWTALALPVLQLCCLL